ncbi:PepSY domain-containing protein [Nonomuraea dietziae]|uniref:PepSY domain-containing protein n=1 Tax=Nonomuraea dietziae TaxID=65515 RepID=UPI003F4D4359
MVGLLFLSATGLTWSKYAGENVDELRAVLGWTTPTISTSSGDHAGHSTSSGHQHGASGVDVDRVVQAAAGKGLSGPLEIVWPGEAGAPYLVKEIDKSVPQRLDQVAVDATTGQVSAELRFADYPLAAKLTRWGIDGHMGLLFGLANQVLLALLASGVTALIVLGYRMWWQRRPTRGFGKPYPRGGWAFPPSRSTRAARWSRGSSRPGPTDPSRSTRPSLHPRLLWSRHRGRPGGLTTTPTVSVKAEQARGAFAGCGSEHHPNGRVVLTGRQWVGASRGGSSRRCRRRGRVRRRCRPIRRT